MVFGVVYEDVVRYTDMCKKNVNKRNVIDETRRGIQTKKNSIQTVDLERMLTVDIAKNFRLHSCFGSVSIMEILEGYIYETMLSLVMKFFELRLKIEASKEQLVKRMIVQLSKLGEFASEKQQAKNVNLVFKTLWKIPQLKELSDGMQPHGDKKKDGVVAAKKREQLEKPLTKAEILKAYMSSAQ